MNEITCKCFKRGDKALCGKPAEKINVVWKGSNIYLPGAQTTGGWLSAEADVCRMHLNNTLQKGRSLEYMTNTLIQDEIKGDNTCPKCGGAGMLSWTGVDNGRCWQCGGTGKCDKPENTAVLVVGTKDEAKKEWMANWRGKGHMKLNRSTGKWEIHHNK